MSRARRVAATATLDIDNLSGWWRGHEQPGGDHAQRPTNYRPHRPPKALEAAAIAISLVMRVPAPLKSLADQVIRSATLGACESLRRPRPSVATGCTTGASPTAQRRRSTPICVFSSAPAPSTHRRPIRQSVSSTTSVLSPGAFSTRNGDLEVTRDRGLPRGAGYGIVPDRPSGTRCALHNAVPGSPGRNVAVFCSGHEAGRRRPIGGVATLPIHHLRDPADGATPGRRRRTGRPVP